MPRFALNRCSSRANAVLGGHHYLRTAFPDVIPELTRDLLKAYRNVDPY